MQHIFSFFSTLFDAVASYWFPYSGVLFVPAAGVQSFFTASMFVTKNKRLAAISPFTAKVFNLIGVIVPIAGFSIFSHWTYNQLEIYNVFLGAASNFCWIADSNGNTLDLVLIYTASCARVIYGMLILYRYLGAEARKNLVDKVTNSFRPLVDFIWSTCKKVKELISEFYNKKKLEIVNFFHCLRDSFWLYWEKLKEKVSDFYNKWKPEIVKFFHLLWDPICLNCEWVKERTSDSYNAWKAEVVDFFHYLGLCCTWVKER